MATGIKDIKQPKPVPAPNSHLYELAKPSVASSRSALVLALVWWPVGFALATVYFLFISRRYAGKVSVRQDNQGFY